MLSIPSIFHMHFKSCVLRSFCQHHLLSFCLKLLSQKNLFSQETNVFFFPTLPLNVSDHSVTKPQIPSAKGRKAVRGAFFIVGKVSLTLKESAAFAGGGGGTPPNAGQGNPFPHPTS